MWLNVCGLILIKITSMYRVKWVTVLIKFFLDFAVKRETKEINIGDKNSSCG